MKLELVSLKEYVQTDRSQLLHAARFLEAEGNRRAAQAELEGRDCLVKRNPRGAENDYGPDGSNPIQPATPRSAE